MTAGPTLDSDLEGTRWLVTGARGMLGTDLVELLRNRGAGVVGVDRDELDVTDPQAARAAIGEHRPHVVVNAAAFTAVDDAELREAEAFAVNAVGPALLADACLAAEARSPLLVQVSTDYVFAGDASTPYAEESEPAPRTVYGRTKLAGERAVRERMPATGYVLRTAWLYGRHGHNFVSTMLRRALEDGPVRVVDDQYGQPTWTADLADRIATIGLEGMARHVLGGVFHATSSGKTTWCGLAREVFELAGADPGRVLAVSTAEFPRPAARPAYSVLGHEAWSRAGLAPIGDWRYGLRRAWPSLIG